MKRAFFPALLALWLTAAAPAAETAPPAWMAVPPVAAAGQGIDALVQANLDQRGWAFSPPAEPASLLRRVSLDLSGLPPTPTEVADFVRDPSPAAYVRVVDRLLASPRFGERWAPMWLDLARFADTQGYEKDNLRIIWAYRDWVIQAFNDDLPFDRFTIEQLAGDLLPSPSADQLIATAFHRNTLTNTEGGTDDEEFRLKAVIDRTNTTATTWLGLTLGCAQCHDHPSAPISQREYFEFFAFFNNTADADRDDDQPTLSVRALRDRPAEAALRQTLAQARQRLAAKGTDPTAQAEITEAERALEELPATTLPIMRELPAAQARVTHLFHRGDWRQPAEAVTAGVPAYLTATSSVEPMCDRLDLARWLVSGKHPLTARVHVNRLWAQLFGTGLVATLEDFGQSTTAPLQQPLLDYLAAQFQGEWRWSTKRLLRAIVLSKVYQQSSTATAEQRQADPENRWLARGARFRLSAETIRDQALAAAGLLSDRLYGPSVMPPQPEGTWQVVYNVQRWKTSPGENRYRRGLYTFWRRTSPYPGLAAFDAPTRETCVARRGRANSPAGALVTLNDPVFTEAADALARRMQAEGGATVEDRVRYGWRLLLARDPSSATIIRLCELYAKTQSYGMVASALLNLDETLTRE